METAAQLVARQMTQQRMLSSSYLLFNSTQRIALHIELLTRATAARKIILFRSPLFLFSESSADRKGPFGVSFVSLVLQANGNCKAKAREKERNERRVQCSGWPQSRLLADSFFPLFRCFFALWPSFIAELRPPDTDEDEDEEEIPGECRFKLKPLRGNKERRESGSAADSLFRFGMKERRRGRQMDRLPPHPLPTLPRANCPTERQAARESVARLALLLHCPCSALI